MNFKKSVLAMLFAGTFAVTAQAQVPAEVKLGLVTILSGPAASPFGVPARNAAELMLEQFNAGTAPAPYNKRVLAATLLSHN